MAMIINIGIPREEAQAIGRYLASDGLEDIPVVGEEGAKVLEAFTKPRDPNSMWRTVIGTFVEFTESGDGYWNHLGRYVTMADVLIGDDGLPTDRHGQVVVDYENPEAAYVVGVPI